MGKAIAKTDTQLKRTDINYDRQLIQNIYDARTDYMVGLRNKAIKEGRKADAQGFSNIINNRMPQERAMAAKMLEAELAPPKPSR